MTCLLIVEDDPALASALARAVTRAKLGYTVRTCHDGAAAVRVLEQEPIDLVLTDLQMSGMDGFSLLAWLVSERPGVLVFAMTGYSSPEAQGRLRELGAIECFDKPVDVPALLARFAESMAQRVDGHVRHLGLVSLLQLVEIERKTCTLEVRGSEGVGRLYVRKGVLVDARTEQLAGEAAALQILTYGPTSITLEGRCLTPDRTIVRPLGQLIMEAVQLYDERTRDRRTGRDSQPDESMSPLERRSRTPPRPLPPLPAGIFALLLVEIATGHVLAFEARDPLGMAELGEGGAAVLRSAQGALSGAPVGEGIEEIVLSTASRCEVLRPLPGSDEDALVLVFDAAETNLVIARLELSRLIDEYGAGR